MVLIATVRLSAEQITHLSDAELLAVLAGSGPSPAPSQPPPAPMPVRPAMPPADKRNHVPPPRVR